MKTKSSILVEYQAFELWESGVVGTLFGTSDGRVLSASPAVCRPVWEVLRWGGRPFYLLAPTLSPKGRDSRQGFQRRSYA